MEYRAKRKIGEQGEWAVSGLDFCLCPIPPPGSLFTGYFFRNYMYCNPLIYLETFKHFLIIIDKVIILSKKDQEK